MVTEERPNWPLMFGSIFRATELLERLTSMVLFSVTVKSRDLVSVAVVA